MRPSTIGRRALGASAAVALCLSGCFGDFPAPPGTADADTLVGSNPIDGVQPGDKPPASDAGDASTPADPPPDNLPPPPPPPDGDCTPGALLGGCLVCGPTGQPEIGNGSACPPVACESNDRFARQDEGDDVVCVLLRHALLGDRCGPDGACLGANSPQVCQVFERIVQARAEGACEVMVGCEGDQPPSTRRAEVGTPCGEGRACDVTGRCSRQLDCGAFPGTVCGRNRPQDPPFCDLEVDPPGGGADESSEPEHSCEAVCDTNGAQCAGAWSAPGNCGRGDPIGCNAFEDDAIVCRCVPSTR